MIKWLLCLLWGHDSDNKNLIKCEMVDGFGGSSYEYKAYCRRCKKYRSRT